jgi:hypothetical protein
LTNSAETERSTATVGMVGKYALLAKELKVVAIETIPTINAFF